MLVVCQAGNSNMEKSTPGEMCDRLGKGENPCGVSYLVLQVPLYMWEAIGSECPLHSCFLIFQKYILVVKIQPYKPYF